MKCRLSLLYGQSEDLPIWKKASCFNITHINTTFIIVKYYVEGIQWLQIDIPTILDLEICQNNYVFKIGSDWWDTMNNGRKIGDSQLRGRRVSWHTGRLFNLVPYFKQAEMGATLQMNLMVGHRCPIIHQLNPKACLNQKRFSWRRSKWEWDYLDVMYILWCSKLVFIFDHLQPQNNH